VENLWCQPSLTARDAAAPDVSTVLTLATPRIDDPLAGVVVPVAAPQAADVDAPSHLQQIQAELVAKLPVPDAEGGMHHTMPALKTSSDYSAYIRTRTAAWQASRKSTAAPAHP
jgi:phospholipase C